MPVPELTLTEEQIVLLLAEGLSKGAVAEVLGLDERTVDWHLGRASRKLEHASNLNEHMQGMKQ